VADYREAFVGIDVAKLKNAIAIAESGRNGEIRYVGEVEASDASMRRTIQRMAAKFDHVHFCYEAGPTGYGLHRLIKPLGHEALALHIPHRRTFVAKDRCADHFKARRPDKVFLAPRPV
jgi:hypothetical protein